MKIGINLWAWGSHFGTDEYVRLIGRAKSFGAELVEIGVEDERPIDTDSIKLALEDERLECSIVGVFGPHLDVSSEDRVVRGDGVAFARHCIEVAAGVGAPVFTGAVVGAGGRGVVSAASRRMRLEYAAEGLREIGDIAADAGVRFGFEVLNRFEANLVNTARQARELVDLADHPNAGILLDTFHMNIEETDPRGAVATAGDRLVHVQVSDSHRGPPGEGLFPWGEVGAALNDMDYRGFVAIECFNPESRMAPMVCLWRPVAESPDALARDGMAFLKKTFRG